MPPSRPPNPILRFLVTAGGTREAIDRVRDWGNVFTGNTGFGIARALAEIGEVTLVTSNTGHIAELAKPQSTKFAFRAEPFRSYDDLRSVLDRLMCADRFTGVFMSAAVSDYTPAGAYQVVERRPSNTAEGDEVWVVRKAQAGKVKSTFDELAILGKRTEKLVDLFRRDWKFDGLLVKFKLEVGISADRLVEIGQASRLASGADYLVANTLDIVEGPNAGAYLLSEGKSEWVPRAELPGRLCQLVLSRK